MYYMSVKNEWGNNAGSKAKNDIEDIFKNIDNLDKLINKTLLCKNKRNIKYYIDGFISSNKLKLKLNKIENEILLIQYPLQKLSVYQKSLFKASKRNKLVFIIHDINCLRHPDRISDDLEILKYAAYIISHNECMTKYLIDNGIDKNKIIDLGIFDYLIDEVNITKRTKNDGIAFAGNLDKSIFLQKYIDNNFQPNLHLYGLNSRNFSNSSNAKYHGSFSPEKLVEIIKGSFGLVWDGEEMDSLSGKAGEYLKYNNPHKTSLYLVSGLPIITHKDAAIAKFINENNIGITVNSLKDIDEAIKKLTVKEYDEIQKNVIKLGEKLAKGFYTNKMIKTVKEKCNV